MLDAEVLRHVQENQESEKQHQHHMLVNHHNEDPIIVAVEEVQDHDIQHSVPTHNVIPQNNASFFDIDSEMAKKLKKQKKTHSSKKSNSIDANGNPIDKRKSAAMLLAQEIVQRYRERGNVLPKEWIQRKGDPVKEREYRDKNKLRKWRQSLEGNYKGNICFQEIKEYLDKNMPTWSQGRQAKFRPTIEAAQGIIERYYARGSVIPHVQTAQPLPSALLSTKLLELQQQLQQPSSSSSSASSAPMNDGANPVGELPGPYLTGTESEGEITSSFDTTEVLAAKAQESHDAEALSRWRQLYNRSEARKKKEALKNSSSDPNARITSNPTLESASDLVFESVKDLLDLHIPHWRAAHVEYGDPNAAIKTPRPRHNVVRNPLSQNESPYSTPVQHI